MIKNTLIAVTLVVASLASAYGGPAGTLVLSYSDFGPPSMAWETIGMDWWQWEDQGGSDPNYRYPIKVVVYRGVPLSEVKKLFPVDKNTRRDYRYLSYEQATGYLERNIKENVFLPVTDKLRKTLGTIIEKLGTPDSLIGPGSRTQTRGDGHAMKGFADADSWG